MLDSPLYPDAQTGVQDDADLGPLSYTVYFPNDAPPARADPARKSVPRLSRWTGIKEAARLFAAAFSTRDARRGKRFGNLPE